MKKVKANGNFINLPYNADGRRALAPDGTEMSLDMFEKCIELNAVNKKQLKDIQEKLFLMNLKVVVKSLRWSPFVLEFSQKK
ncbi:MAG: hypothetical protein CM15mV60_040 [uncultured marine virus]|nr:MAG: hypothetical protein CM15mV60_040 [uncultured marine virus]